MLNLRTPLFDLDWTLIKGGNKAHRLAFSEAIFSAYHLKIDCLRHNFEGMIDAEIFISLLKEQGIIIDSLFKLKPLFAKAISFFQENYSSEKYIPLPGVLDLLKELKKRKIKIGVLTGNIQSIANIKLRESGLLEYIDMAVYGDQATQRYKLVHLFMKKYPGISKSFIVGDSLKDIICAQKAKIPVIAVATGKYTLVDLKKGGANLVLKNLLEQENFFQFLTE